MKKILLILLLCASDCFPQFIPQFNRQPSVGYPINLAHPDAQGLIGLWLFHEGLGSKVYDLTPHGNDGTLTNMVPSDDWVTGRDGWALNFDGSNDYVDLSNPSELIFLAGDSFTLSVWFKTIQTTDQRTIWKFIDGGDIIGIGNSITTANRAAFTLRDQDGNGLVILEGTSNTSDGNWHYIVGVRDVSLDLMLIYVDGVEENTDTDGTGADFNAGGSGWAVGRAGTVAANHFSGSIEDVRIFGRALGAKEIMSNYINSYPMFEQPPGRILTVAAVTTTPATKPKGKPFIF